jgi:hypothetical protein
MQQFLQHLRRGDELPPARSGFHEEPLRFGSKFWITVDARSYSLDSPASILAEGVRHSRSPSSPQPQDVPQLTSPNPHVTHVVQAGRT